jgi:hypothetical protein
MVRADEVKQVSDRDLLTIIHQVRRGQGAPVTATSATAN